MPSDDRAWASYTEAFRREVLGPLLDSGSMVLVNETWTPDTLNLRAATELGLMLMLDKPLVVLVGPGGQPPRALVRAAREVIWDFDPNDDASQDRVVEAIRRVKEGM